jgi:hypothetical protein
MKTKQLSGRARLSPSASLQTHECNLCPQHIPYHGLDVALWIQVGETVSVYIQETTACKSLRCQLLHMTLSPHLS